MELKAFVKVPIYVSPRHVYIFGKEGQSATKVVEVRTELDKPLKLTPGDFSLEKKLTYTMEEIEEGRKFQFRFTSIPGPPGSLSGFLKLKTNYPEKPEVIIRIRGRIQEERKEPKPPDKAPEPARP